MPKKQTKKQKTGKMQPAIIVKSLRKEFKAHKREPGLWNAFKSLFKRETRIKHALKGVSFKISEGEIVGLIGPNGAGKSTLIKVLSGVLYPSSGYVNVTGFTPWEERERYVKNIGVVFGQKHQLYWDLPPADTYELHRDIYDIPKKDFEKRKREMIRFLCLKEISKVPVRSLSLGERMRSEIVAAMLHNPKLVFLDEPSIGLDVIAKDRLRDFIINTNRKYQTTFIITTHDMQDIEKLCKRVIIINHGIIIYDGPMARIRDSYLTHKHIEARFVTKPKRFRFRGAKIIEQKPYELKIELDTGERAVKDFINYLLGRFDVADITVTNPPVEEVIQAIFRERGKLDVRGAK